MPGIFTTLMASLDGFRGRPRREVDVRLPGGDHAPGAARSLALQVAGERLDRQRCDKLALLVSELVTNAVLHGGMGPGDQIELKLEVLPDAVHVEVADTGPGFGGAPERPERHGGWGLRLVEQLADRWRIERNGGTRVSFEVAC